MYNVVICFVGGRTETFSNVSAEYAAELESNFGSDPTVSWIAVTPA